MMAIITLNFSSASPCPPQIPRPTIRVTNDHFRMSWVPDDWLIYYPLFRWLITEERVTRRKEDFKAALSLLTLPTTTQPCPRKINKDKKKFSFAAVCTIFSPHRKRSFLPKVRRSCSHGFAWQPHQCTDPESQRLAMIFEDRLPLTASLEE